MPAPNRSGAFGGASSATRELFTRASTCAVPDLSVKSALTVDLPGAWIVSVAPANSPNEDST